MVDLWRLRGSLHITHTAVCCRKDLRIRRSFRSLVACMVPCFGFLSSSTLDDSIDTSSITVTFFGYRRGHVSFCLHDSSHTIPLLLIDFAIPTTYLAHEMRHGLLRITLKCTGGRSTTCSLFQVPVWNLYCNGRKVGFAVRRQMSEADVATFKLMQSVSVGAGVLPGESNCGEVDLTYLRVSFQRVSGSVDSESFHMINPAGSIEQELSIFLLRSYGEDAAW